MADSNSPSHGFSDRFKALQLDTRMLGMVGAFLVICIVFNIFTDGRFLTPRNLFNLTIQTASIAVMATGMVFVIVTRHIDLSVGSVLGMTATVMAVLQVKILPEMLGYGHPSIWAIAIVAGILAGTLIGAFQGWIIGYLGVPAFIVTLGGFLVWRGAVWWTSGGQTLGPLDPTFKMMGGSGGTLGTTWSWVLALVAIAVTVLLLTQSRRGKVKHGFDVKPVWAEYTVGAILVAIILGFTAILNAYQVPTRALIRTFEARGEVMPEGYTQGYGIPLSVLVVIAVTVTMTIIARKTRFGRYVFATGGNPDAAELSGINIKFLTVKIFALMGALTAISAVIASARLGNSTNDLGTLDELRVIAAAIIGGTALAGGVGTIYGAVLGALIMQSLQSGMAMVGVDAPLQNIVVGIVLVLAVLIDTAYRRRTGE